jgi:hypothetical protein
MSYGANPDDHLYGYDEQEDRWESQYADYLEEMIDLQHQAETEAEHEAAMSFLDDQMQAQRNYDMAERYREGTHLEPGDYNTIDEELIQDSLAHQLLHLPLGDNDAQAATVGEYLGLLLSTLWLQADGFSAKRPFGNSDWQYVIYMAMVKAGLATGVVYDENGFEYLDEIDEVAADEIILQAIQLAYNHG